MNALPLSPAARVALIGVTLSAVGWAVVVLFGRSGLTGMVAVAVVYGVTDPSLRSGAVRSEQAAVTRALIGHVDPGHGLRAKVDGTARRQLAGPAVDRWGPSTLLIALAVACLVHSVVRDRWTDALPALPLVLLAAMLLILVRRADALAHRWLADPRGRRARCHLRAGGRDGSPVGGSCG